MWIRNTSWDMDVVHECDGQTVCIAYTLHLHAVRRAVRKHYELTKVGLIRLTV